MLIVNNKKMNKKNILLIWCNKFVFHFYKKAHQQDELFCN